MREPRSAVMTMVEASWQDESGTQRIVPACMEVKSAGGACIRLKTPISVGSKLSIRWRFDAFTGTARNCRSEGREYLVGIQRDAQRDPADTPIVSPPIPPVAPPPVERVISSEPQLSPAAAAAAWTARMRSLRTPQEIRRQESKPQEVKPQPKIEEPKPPENKPQETQQQANRQQETPSAKTSPIRASQLEKPRETPSAKKAPELKPRETPVFHHPQETKPTAPAPAQRKAEAMPFVRIVGRAAVLLPRRVDHEMRIRDGPIAAQSPGSEPARSTEPQVKPPPQGKDPGKERKRMRPKWLGLAPWHHKQEAVSESRNGNRTTPGHTNDEGEKENFMPHATPPTSMSMNIRKTSADSVDDSAPFQVDLLPMEDIYRAAGIMSPPKGYGIKKVIDMLNSEYVRALSKEMKRAAVLMALDAAGVPISQLQQDARARQDALDSYEAAQRKQVEAEWARKAEENVQIQAELERVKAHHQARIARNLDAIEREKVTFSNWLAIKQQETHSMLEAAELCLKAPENKSDTSKPEATKPEVTKEVTNSEANVASLSNLPGGALSDVSLSKAAAAGKPM